MRKWSGAPRCSSAAAQPRDSERRLSFYEWVFGGGGGGGGTGAGAVLSWPRGSSAAQGLCSAAGGALCPPPFPPTHRKVSLPSPHPLCNKLAGPTFVHIVSHPRAGDSPTAGGAPASPHAVTFQSWGAPSVCPPPQTTLFPWGGAIYIDICVLYIYICITHIQTLISIPYPCPKSIPYLQPIP